MYYQASSKDDIALLTESSVNSTVYGTNATTQRSTRSPPSTILSDVQDSTVHYLSPASTTARTQCEGDFDYQQFYISPMYPQDSTYKAGLGSSSSSSTSLPCDENTLQRTLAIIKPDALGYKDVVLRAINQAGLKIVNRAYVKRLIEKKKVVIGNESTLINVDEQYSPVDSSEIIIKLKNVNCLAFKQLKQEQRLVHLTPEQVSEIYEKYYGTPAFPHLVVTVSISPILVLSLQAVNAVEKWRLMVGPMGTLREEWFFPYSVRTRFGLLPDFPNSLHASEGVNDARRENRYFYPRDVQEPLPADGDKVKDYITTFVKPTLLLGLTEIVKTKPFDPVVSLAEWLLLHNPYQPKVADAIAMLPT